MQIVHIRKSKKFTKIYYIIYSVASVIAFGFSTPVSAESLPTTVSIKPSLSINIPSNTVNLVLDPSMNDFGSSSTTITVATNNPNGYKLYLSSSTTNLTNINDNTYTIPTLASSTSEANFPANYWGYKLNSDTTTNYLPYQSDTLVSESTTATNGTSSTATFAAKVDYTKPAGLYSSAFDLKTIPIVTQTYMQDMDPSVCTETPTIVIDKRDEQIYTIRRIGSTGCWMIDNLRFAGTELSSSTSNISSVYTDANPYLVNNGSGYGNLTSGNSYNEARIHIGVDDKNNPTIWYNYAAASAETITSDNNNNNAEYDICPSKWKLPTTAEQSALIDFIDTVPSIFTPVVGGTWGEGAIRDVSYGTFWSSTVSNVVGFRTFYYHKPTNTFKLNGGGRYLGFFIRCLLQE